MERLPDRTCVDRRPL